MSCHYCKTLVLGDIYNAEGVVYTECCQEPVDTLGMKQKYVDFDRAFHWFRVLRSIKCPSCGHVVNSIAIQCDDYTDGLFIKEKVNEYSERYK